MRFQGNVGLLRRADHRSKLAVFVNALLTAERHGSGMKRPAPRSGLTDCYRRSLVGAVAAGTVIAVASLALAQSLPVVSQKGRQFRPGELTIKRGEAVQIVNDDADLRHHAYIDADSFKYDSGDQEPGSKATIPFTVAGDFDVLCAIHPKMKLAVHVK